MNGVRGLVTNLDLTQSLLSVGDEVFANIGGSGLNQVVKKKNLLEFRLVERKSKINFCSFVRSFVFFFLFFLPKPKKIFP